MTRNLNKNDAFCKRFSITTSNCKRAERALWASSLAIALFVYFFTNGIP